MPSYPKTTDMAFKQFPLKYANKCFVCGKKLPEGTKAYGAKVGAKWKFCCNGCYETAVRKESYEEPTAVDIPDEIEGGPSIDELLGEELPPKTYDPDSEFVDPALLKKNLDEAINDMPKAKRPKEAQTVMQLIKQKAQWKI